MQTYDTPQDHGGFGRSRSMFRLRSLFTKSSTSPDNSKPAVALQSPLESSIEEPQPLRGSSRLDHSAPGDLNAPALPFPASPSGSSRQPIQRTNSSIEPAVTPTPRSPNRPKQSQPNVSPTRPPLFSSTGSSKSSMAPTANGLAPVENMQSWQEPSAASNTVVSTPGTQNGAVSKAPAQHQLGHYHNHNLQNNGPKASANHHVQLNGSKNVALMAAQHAAAAFQQPPPIQKQIPRPSSHQNLARQLHDQPLYPHQSPSARPALDPNGNTLLQPPPPLKKYPHSRPPSQQNGTAPTRNAPIDAKFQRNQSNYSPVPPVAPQNPARVRSQPPPGTQQDQALQQGLPTARSKQHHQAQQALRSPQIPQTFDIPNGPGAPNGYSRPSSRTTSRDQLRTIDLLNVADVPVKQSRLRSQSSLGLLPSQRVQSPVPSITSAQKIQSPLPPGFSNLGPNGSRSRGQQSKHRLPSASQMSEFGDIQPLMNSNDHRPMRTQSVQSQVIHEDRVVGKLAGASRISQDNLIPTTQGSRFPTSSTSRTQSLQSASANFKPLTPRLSSGEYDTRSQQRQLYHSINETDTFYRSPKFNSSPSLHQLGKFRSRSALDLRAASSPTLMAPAFVSRQNPRFRSRSPQPRLALKQPSPPVNLPLKSPPQPQYKPQYPPPIPAQSSVQTQLQPQAPIKGRTSAPGSIQAFVSASSPVQFKPEPEPEPELEPELEPEFQPQLKPEPESQLLNQTQVRIVPQPPTQAQAQLQSGQQQQQLPPQQQQQPPPQQQHAQTLAQSQHPKKATSSLQVYPEVEDVARLRKLTTASSPTLRTQRDFAQPLAAPPPPPIPTHTMEPPPRSPSRKNFPSPFALYRDNSASSGDSNPSPNPSPTTKEFYPGQPNSLSKSPISSNSSASNSTSAPCFSNNSQSSASTPNLHAFPTKSQNPQVQQFSDPADSEPYHPRLNKRPDFDSQVRSELKAQSQLFNYQTKMQHQEHIGSAPETSGPEHHVEPAPVPALERVTDFSSAAVVQQDLPAFVDKEMFEPRQPEIPAQHEPPVPQPVALPISQLAPELAPKPAPKPAEQPTLEKKPYKPEDPGSEQTPKNTTPMVTVLQPLDGKARTEVAAETKRPKSGKRRMFGLRGLISSNHPDPTPLPVSKPATARPVAPKVPNSPTISKTIPNGGSSPSLERPSSLRESTSLASFHEAESLPLVSKAGGEPPSPATSNLATPQSPGSTQASNLHRNSRGNSAAKRSSTLTVATAESSNSGSYREDKKDSKSQGPFTKTRFHEVFRSGEYGQIVEQWKLLQANLATLTSEGINADSKYEAEQDGYAAVFNNIGLSLSVLSPLLKTSLTEWGFMTHIQSDIIKKKAETVRNIRMTNGYYRTQGPKSEEEQLWIEKGVALLSSLPQPSARLLNSLPLSAEMKRHEVPYTSLDPRAPATTDPEEPKHAIPSSRYPFPPTMDYLLSSSPDTTCPVCMEQFTPSSQVVVLPCCLHIFHPDPCLVDWVTAPKNKRRRGRDHAYEARMDEYTEDLDLDAAKSKGLLSRRQVKHEALAYEYTPDHGTLRKVDVSSENWSKSLKRKQSKFTTLNKGGIIGGPGESSFTARSLAKSFKLVKKKFSDEHNGDSSGSQTSLVPDSPDLDHDITSQFSNLELARDVRVIMDARLARKIERCSAVIDGADEDGFSHEYDLARTVTLTNGCPMCRATFDSYL